MKILLFGYGEMGCAGLEFLRSRGERVAGVITHRDDPGEKRWFRSLEEAATGARIPVFQDEGSDLEFVVRGLEPDLILSFYFRKLIPMRVLNVAPRGALNLHGSLLPRLRGRAPLNWALVEGEQRTGVTLHHMVDQADAGDIVAQRAFDIGPRDTARTLFDKAVEETKLLLDEAWPGIRDGTAPRIPQDHSKATYRGRRRPEDGLIDWRQATRRIDGLVRAVADPFPGAFTTLGGSKLMVWEGSPAEGRGEPGRVIRRSVVATSDGAYKIERCEFSAPGRAPALDPGVRLGE
ncbi:MAG TPA: formyltransferase family protein [Planctomycetota bacterium]|nr:formyltransferase family protein [Planctomycetota bacterium]